MDESSTECGTRTNVPCTHFRVLNSIVPFIRFRVLNSNVLCTHFRCAEFDCSIHTFSCAEFECSMHTFSCVEFECSMLTFSCTDFRCSTDAGIFVCCVQTTERILQMGSFALFLSFRAHCRLRPFKLRVKVLETTQGPTFQRQHNPVQNARSHCVLG